jgi:periplasmic divalent cation tolerance protein
VTEFVLVLTTLPADADGQSFASVLVERRLAACVNILPAMESVYRWKGAIERDAERQVLIKTRRDLVGELKRQLQTLHPYEVPELIVLPIADGSDAYLAWLHASTA